MTRTLAVDARNDLFIGEQDVLPLVSGLPAVLFLCQHAAKTLLNEMVLAFDQGLPYFQAVWTGAPRLAQFEGALRAALLAVDGVAGIVALDLRLDGETLKYNATIATEFGEGNLSGSI